MAAACLAIPVLVQAFWLPDDGSDQVQCFDDGALTGVVPTDNNRISMKRDGMVVEATIILKTKRA